MISQANQKFWDCYHRLPDSVRQQARKNYRLFMQDINHPSLDFKPVHTAKSIYSVRIGIHYRAMGVRRGELIVWFWIGSHAEYDKLLSRL